MLRARFGGVAPLGAGAPLLPVVEQALAAERDGLKGEAERLSREVLELAPGQPEALALRYRLSRAEGRAAAAEALLRRIVQLHPNTLWATHELALLLLGKGAVAEAELMPATGCASPPKTRSRTT